MGGNSGGGEARRARQEEQERQERIRQGTNRINDIFSQFDDSFYSGRRNAYLDYATPQLDDQYEKVKHDLVFSLTRSGNLDSTVRAEKEADLQKHYDLLSQQLADEALSQESGTRTSIENARSDLIATLNATGDAQGAANSALARAAMLSQPASFSPLTNLFADFTAALGTQAALERADAQTGGRVRPRYNTRLFGSDSGSVSVR